jgi:hypothetical protein
MGIFRNLKDWVAGEISEPLSSVMTSIDSLQARLDAGEDIVQEDIDQLQDSVVSMVGRLFGEDWYWSDETGEISSDD